MIRYPKWDPDSTSATKFPDDPPPEVVLPPKPVIDAGVAKFMELAKLFWPSKDGKLAAFDTSNQPQLRMMLGLVYLEMLKATPGDISGEFPNGPAARQG